MAVARRGRGRPDSTIAGQEFGRQLVSARRALALAQRELALPIGTGRRFIVDLGRGKSTAQRRKALAAVKAIGMRLENTAGRH